MNVCTIIAKNYLAPARVLARSLAETNPGSRMWTLVIDDFEGYLDPSVEPFEVLTPADVGCDPFVHMALRYSVLELSTAVKPWLMSHLMRLTGEPVTYLDPDIRIYGSLQRLDDLAARHGVVLTPHTTRPIPQDGRTPSQVDVMIAGIYNLGYVSLAPGPEVDAIIDWWADRLRRDCRVDPLWGYFVDQRWFDLAPGFLSDLAIVRDPEFNVAYWNLHQRRLEQGADGGYTLDGRPLGFFHFSGFDAERPLVLSRHQSRIDVADRPELERLLADYAAETLAAGHAQSRHWPYSLGRLGDGTEPDDELRALFDTYATEHGDAVDSPFTAEGMAAFDRWLSAQAPGSPAGVSRAMAQVYRDRADVRGAFPDLRGTDARPFLEWVAGPGAQQERVLARTDAGIGAVATETPTAPTEPPTAPPGPPGLPGPPGPPLAEAPLRDGPWGINLVGSTAESAAVLAALDVGQVPVAPLVPGGEPVYVVTLVVAATGELTRRINELGPDAMAGRYAIALVDGAADVGVGVVDEVWVAAGELPASAPVPVHAVDLADPETIAVLARRRLQSIQATGRARRAADPIVERPRALARLPLRLRQGPFPATPGTGQAARERLRQAVLRVIKPFTAYQQAVNADLVAALTELSTEITAEHRRATADRAAAGADARRAFAAVERMERSEERLAAIEGLLQRVAERLERQ